jgi:branched-chain amino acid transport system ATP-binding protein
MLEVREINSFYGEFQVIRNVSITVGESQLIVLLGPNGHGKSSLLKTICGLITTQSGSIRFNGVEIAGLSTEKIVQMGLTYIAEERHLFPEMTGLENLKLGAYVSNARQKEAENLEYVFQLFPRVEERQKQLASTLSGGEARMLAIARGLMSNAKLLAVDEPSLGLSPLLRIHVLEKIVDINERGMTVLLVEQTMPKVSEVADRIYLMEDGAIVFEGGKEEALSDEHIKSVFLGI